MSCVPGVLPTTLGLHLGYLFVADAQSAAMTTYSRRSSCVRTRETCITASRTSGMTRSSEDWHSYTGRLDHHRHYLVTTSALTSFTKFGAQLPNVIRHSATRPSRGTNGSNTILSKAQPSTLTALG